jgi:hypothetical protein
VKGKSITIEKFSEVKCGEDGRWTDKKVTYNDPWPYGDGSADTGFDKKY